MSIQRPTHKVVLPKGWLLFETATELAEFTFESILEIAKQAIDKRGVFHFVTAGGTTPLQVYRLLADYESKQADSTVDWSKWHIYIGDERCLPVNDPERNSLALESAWLANSHIPAANIHAMPAELGPEKAATAYEAVVKGIKFDVVLLGMGEDGHTASLFPGHSHDHESDRLVQTEFNSPKPPSERVTLSAACLENSRFLFKLITGSGKQQAVKQLLDDKKQGVNKLPIALVNGNNAKTLVSADSLPI